VLPHLVIPLVLAFQVVLGGPASPAQGPAQGAAPTALQLARAAETDRAASELARVQRRRAQQVAEKRELERRYEAQLRELDRLKRSKASWRRDRQVRSNQADSQATAERLSRVDAELRSIDSLLRPQRQALLAAIDRERAVQPTALRRALLDRMRGQVVAALQPRVRKILVPDDTLDELADPEDLAEQIALIQQVEVELRRERESLRQREERYTRMARLREQRERASQMGELEEDVVRRTAGRSPSPVSAGGGSRNENDNPSGPAEPTNDGPGGGDTLGERPGFETGGPPEDGGFEQSSILLADVVDSSTVDALRRAGRSASPKARAEAAARARTQVEARLSRFERSRALIQRHLNELRRGR
jgi:hypothetical protein